MKLGAHESVAGGAFNAIAFGREDGCEAVQIFARPSSQWRTRPFQPDEVSMFRSELASVGWPAMSHASYLINVCATDPITLERSIVALAEEMSRAEELGLDYVVLHPGAHLGCGEEAGLETAARTLSEVMARSRGFGVRLLLEITAGQGSCLGCRFEHMARLLERTRGGEHLGICFDTCHAHAAGYDLTSEEGYERTFEEVARVIGIESVRAFHLNDSKTPRGSRVDRHQEIGDGHLGLLPFWRLVNDARFAATPAVLETPSGPDGKRSFRRNLVRLRSLIGAPRPEDGPRSVAVEERAAPGGGFD